MALRWDYEKLDYPEIFQKIRAKREANGTVKDSYKKNNWLPAFVGVELSPFYLEQDNIM